MLKIRHIAKPRTVSGNFMTNLKSVFIFLVILCFGCTSTEVKDYQPKRIANIPDSAFWKGGVDGGNWFLVKAINSHENIVDISIYNDQDGSLIFTKAFMLICRQDKQTIIGDLEKQINFFDGEKIHFINQNDIDCYLSPKD